MPDELDRILDECLDFYVSAGDRPGLEQRVMARVRAPKRARTLTGVWGIPTGMAAVAAAICIAVVSRPGGPAPVLTIKLPVPPRPPVIAAIAPVPARTGLKRASVQVGEPKLQQFPSPSPLTPEERAFLRLAQFDPGELKSLGQPAQALEIPPLEIKDLDKQEE